jgi:trimeric autotransporter adhesin
VTVFPCGERALVASVNYVAGQTVSNAVVAPVSGSGTVCFYSHVLTDLVVDVNGWFAVGQAFTAVSPERVFDTRGESPNVLRQVPVGQVSAVNVVEVKVTDLPGGVVPAVGVGAVSLNVAVTNPVAAGFVTVFPCGERALVASVNYVAGQTVSNAVIAPVSASGTVCFYSHAPADVVVDVSGWFAAGSAVTPVVPLRVFDTRGESVNAHRQVPVGKVGGGNVLEVSVVSLAGEVPAAGVGAVSLNVAVTNPAAAGFVTVYPCGTRTLVASVNYTAGQTVSNAVIAPVSANGTICFYSYADTDLVVDLNAWIGA